MILFTALFSSLQVGRPSRSRGRGSSSGPAVNVPRNGPAVLPKGAVAVKTNRTKVARGGAGRFALTIRRRATIMTGVGELAQAPHCHGVSEFHGANRINPVPGAHDGCGAFAVLLHGVVPVGHSPRRQSGNSASAAQ